MSLWRHAGPYSVALRISFHGSTGSATANLFVGPAAYGIPMNEVKSSPSDDFAENPSNPPDLVATMLFCDERNLKIVYYGFGFRNHFLAFSERDRTICITFEIVFITNNINY